MYKFTGYKITITVSLFVIPLNKICFVVHVLLNIPYDQEILS